MSKALLALMILFLCSAKAADNAGNNQFLILPIVAYTNEQGLGLGANAVWLGIEGSNWDTNLALFATTLYNQLYLFGDVTNKKFLGSLYFSMGGFVYRSQRSLFYGLGNNTSIDSVSQYSTLDQSLNTKIGFYPIEKLVTGVGLGYRTTSIDRGADTSISQYLELYPNDPHISGTTGFTTTLFAQYDTRDGIAPQSGELAHISWETSQPWGNADVSYQKLKIDALKLWPISEKSLIFVTRGKYEHQWGADVPFFLKSRLGGQNTLRGYKTGRFIDAASQVFNLEPRWTFWTIGSSAFQRMELSLAYEFGRVFNYENLPPFDGYHSNWDIGLTMILGGGLPLRLDYAVSSESNLFYLHLFYPF